MNGSTKGKALVSAVLCLPFLLVSVSASTFIKPKKIKATGNPTEYAKFSVPLTKQEQLHHALERLTFGPRAGDLGQLEQIGLKHWLELQLNPSRVPENPTLEERLAPLASLDMSVHETYAHYPSRQMIVAFARGKGKLPDDPYLRTVVVRLADRYLQKRDARSSAASTAPENSAAADNEEDLALKSKLSDILPADQVDALRNGRPDQKQAVLASIPSDKQNDFAWALRPAEVRPLLNLAPVVLRRQMMLSINPSGVVASDLSEGKLLRAIYSNHQLTELLTDFWYNHFNVFINKGGDRYFVPTYEREAIRPHVLGTFYDLLLATAKSPAMLFYLDNWQSVGPDSKMALAMRNRNRPQRGLNENYGRELLELHTLGVDGGYTQKDVIAVARCFTGWTIQNPKKGGAFEYDDRRHDKGQKIVLGHVIAGGGMDDGLKVLRILAQQPATAHFISLKLAQRFVADNPPPSLVDRMAKTFLKTDGDLRAVTQTMIISPEFWSQGAYQAKIKSPFEMVASAARATNADVTSAFSLANELQKLGEPLYRKIEPTGYSDANAEWISSAALLERMNFSLALAHNRVSGAAVDTTLWQTRWQNQPISLAKDILERQPSRETETAIDKVLASQDAQLQLARNARAGPPQITSLVAGLALGSPEFQRR